MQFEDSVARTISSNCRYYFNETGQDRHHCVQEFSDDTQRTVGHFLSIHAAIQQHVHEYIDQICDYYGTHQFHTGQYIEFL